LHLSSTGEQLDIEEEDEEEEESIPFSEHDSWASLLPEVDSQPKALSNTAEPPNTIIAWPGEDDTMKQKEDISGDQLGKETKKAQREEAHREGMHIGIR
jgi:hypothetical protein